MSTSACCLRYDGFFLPSRLVYILQKPYKHRFRRISATSSSVCVLQYAGFLRPAKLQPDAFVQGSYKHRLLQTSAVPSY